MESGTLPDSRLRRAVELDHAARRMIELFKPSRPRGRTRRLFLLALGGMPPRDAVRPRPMENAAAWPARSR